MVQQNQPVSISPSPMKRLAKLLLECDDASESSSMPPELLEKFNIIADKVHDDFQRKAGKFLHQIDNERHSNHQVKTVIDIFPSSLSYKDEKGRLPIQSAAFYPCSDRFIPLLAKEGIPHVVGGKGKRGGLLCGVPGMETEGGDIHSIINVIQLLAGIVDRVTNAGDGTRREHDEKMLRILEELRAKGLLVKHDVTKMRLLVCANHNDARKRYAYFSDWNPSALWDTKKWDR